MSDYVLLHLAHDVANYLYTPTEHASKFVEDCNKEEESPDWRSTAMLNVLSAELEDHSHSENETALIDRMITMMTSVYLYTKIENTDNATALCIDVAQVIRDYAKCIFAGDIDARKSVARDLKNSLDAAEFTLFRRLHQKSKAHIKYVAYTVSVRCALQNVYKDINAYVTEVLR